ncbi:hypothetical protein [Pseudemcibacter aquimaris]|uniref:hypothetical protein n=1 Tax=Pseudemcibacter aquimaris TaxID=2857064 RepID=UPI0020130312|nr:hypothetical protein [Pseudemcibacter aquimaris]MCC3860398.1 hypothetical protein [Pseudemcibacter aquimaris]WDU57724.1 hypothetical protein KW060_11005 [Pseudemcibacter aquimaris]
MRNIIILVFVLFLSNCGGQDGSSADIPKMSDNPQLQNAYEKCVVETQDGLEKDNPDTEADVMEMMKKMAFDTCNSLVVVTCTKNINSNGCQLMLDQFGG